MKLTKKILSLIMAIAMVATMLPLSAFTAMADEPKDHYLFSYFTGNSTEQQRIKFALSEDGDTYYAINKNDPVITQSLGTRCCRDPYIFEGQDGKYYAIATDMDASGGWWGNSNSFVIWRSDDLVTWGNETIIRVDQITGVDVYRAWAPQVIWDSTENKYMVYFGLAANGYSAGGTKMHYMYTSDLLDQSEYSTPQPMMKNNAVASNDSIDGDITYYNGTYYMFFKDEGNATICIVKSNTVQGLYDTDNIVPLAAGSEIGALEGCQVWWDEDSSQYILMADRYSANGVFACYNIGANLDTFYAAVSANHDISGYYNATMSQNISVLGPRHGSIINITESQYDALVTEYGIATNDDVRYNFNSSNYVAENSWHYDAIQDTSGYSYDLMTNSGQYTYTYTDEHYLALNGSVAFINDPAVKAMLHENKWTVSYDISISEQRGAPTFALTSGDSPSASIDWIRVLDNGQIYLYKNGGYAKIGETQIVTSVEYTFTITYTGSTISFYKDGVLICDDEIGTLGYDNTKSTNYAAFGWTDTIGVSGVHGAFTNVRFRNKAISASQVASETAINSELIYRYNEGEDEVNGRINTTTCGSSGVTTSMSGKRGASYTISAWVNVGSTRTDGASLFSLGWGGTGDNKQYLNLRESGIINYCWNEGSTDHYYDSSSIFTFATNTWYFLQINIIPDGNSCHFRTFVDGNPVNDQTTGYTRMTTHAYLPHAFFLQNSIDVRLGTSNVSWWASASNCYIDDFRVYTKAIDPAVLRNKQLAADRAEAASAGGASQGSTLAEAMGIFEARVAEMAASGYTKLYTNCLPAYEKYKTAVAAVGKGSLVEEDARQGLNAALANMEIFTERTGDANPTGNNFVVGNTGSETYFKNVIYAEGAEAGKTHAFSESAHLEMYDSYGALWKYGCHAYIYYPQCVVLYDGKSGNEPVVPVIAGFINKDHRYSLNMLYTDEDMANFDLAQDWWHGYNDSQSFMWPTANDATIPTDRNNTTEHNDAETINHDASNDTTTYRLHKNGLKYTGTPSSAYTCISSTTWEMMGQYTYLASDRTTGGTITNNVPDIVVIDYSRLTSALKTAANSATNKGYLADLEEKYKAGGLEGIFGAFDSATTLDPNTGCTHFNHTYTYSSNMDAEALECANDIDVSINLLGSITITTDAAEYTDLCAAITAYETKMAEMDEVCVNLENAYKKYLLALEYKDAYEYGGRRVFESPTLAKAAQQLNEATQKMTPYTVPTADSNAASNGRGIKYTNDSADVGSSYYQNIVYWGTEPVTDIPWKGTYNTDVSGFSAYMKAGNNCEVGVEHPPVVLLYDGEDGHNPKFPVFAVAEKNNQDNKNRYVFFIYPSDATTGSNKFNVNSYFELKEQWRGEAKHDYKRTKCPVSWTTAYGYSARSNYVRNTLSGVTYIEGYRYNKTQYNYGSIAANILHYKPSNNGDGNTTNYYEKHTIPWICAIGSSYDFNADPGDNAWATSSTPIYVINYKPLKEKIEGITIAEGSLAVTNYKEGGLVTWLHKLDSLTKIDPNQYDATNHPNGYNYSSNPETATIACANDIKALFDTSSPDYAGDITGTPSGTPDSQTVTGGPYKDLKDAIDEAKNAPSEKGCIKTATWNAYQDALQDAKDAMSDIANAQSGTTTGKQGYTASDIDALADALTDALDNLDEFNNSAHPLIFSYKEAGTHNGYFQCYRNNSHVIWEDENHDESTVVPTDMSVYDATNILYSTLDVTKYTEEGSEIVSSGRGTFNAVKTAPTPVNESGNLTPEVIAQNYVDAGITALLEAVNEANTENVATNVKTFDVTFNVYKNGTAQGTTYTHTYEYGTQVDLNTSLVTDLGSLTCYKWVINGKKLGYRSNSVSLFLQEDTTVNAYCIEKTSGDTNTLNIYSTFNSVYGSYELAENASVVFNVNSGGGSVAVPGDTLNVPNSVYNTITGWKIDNTTLQNGVSYTVADLVEIAGKDTVTVRPVVTNKHQSVTQRVTVDGSTYTDSAHAEDNYYAAVPYDEWVSVNVSRANAYALVIFDGDKFIPVTYADSSGNMQYGFRIIYDMDFFVMTKVNNKYYANNTEITDETLLFYLDRKLPLCYSFVAPDPAYGSNGVYSKYVFNAAFTTNTNLEILECGTLYSNSVGINKNNLVIEKVGTHDGKRVLKKSNTQRDPHSNQYYFTFNSVFTGAVYFRSYVKYKYTYNDGSNNYEETAVAYGDVNVAYYNMAEPSAPGA